MKGKRCGKGWISKDKECKAGKTSGTLELKESNVLSRYLRRRANIQRESDRIRSNSRESAVIVNGRTGNVDYRGKLGTRDSCIIEDVSQIKGNVVIHNHPIGKDGRSSSFSTADVSLATSYNAREIMAVNERYEYSLKPPAQGWNTEFYRDRVMPAYEKRRKEETNIAVRKILRGEIRTNWLGVITDKNYDHYHEIWTKVAKDTGMNYRRTPAPKKRRDSIVAVRNDRAMSELDTLIGTIMGRVYPGRVTDIKSKPLAGQAFGGLFRDQEGRVYDFNLNLGTGKIDYKISSYRTPKRLTRGDAKREKTPSCTVGTLCRGERGFGCVSKTKKCIQKLNRFSTPTERQKLGQLAQSSATESLGADFKETLSKQGIRDLQKIARESGVPYSNQYTKPQLVEILHELKKMEGGEIGRGGKRESKEDITRKTLVRREKQRKEFLDVKPIDVSAIPLSRDELAKRREQEKISKRRRQALKRGVAALFPGGGKVIDEFSKAATIEDAVIAGLVGGIVALRVYESTKNEYENNYRKSIDREGKEAVYGDKMVPEAGRKIKGFYEDPYASIAESKKFVDQLDGTSHTPIDSLSAGKVKRALEDITGSGKKEDSLDYQKKKFSKAIKSQAESKIESATKKLKTQERRLATAQRMEEDASAFKKFIEEQRDNLEQEVRRIEGLSEEERGKATVPIPRNFESAESFQAIGSVLQTPAARESEKVEQRKQRLAMQGVDEADINRELDAYRKELRYEEMRDRIKDSPRKEATFDELKAARNRLNNLVNTNLSPHQKRLIDRTRAMDAIKKERQEDLDAVTEEFGEIAAGSKTGKSRLESLANKAAKEEIERRRVEGIKSKPLIPDFGEVKDGKVSRYQAWVLHNYLEERERNIVKANESIRENPSKYSLATFKSKLNPLIVAGSETAKAEEAGKLIQRKIPSLRGSYVVPVENQFSRQALIGETEKSLLPYISRIGKHVKTALPAKNRIPGLDPTKSNNDDATKLAAQIIAFHQYGVNPRVVAQGVGGSILREALDIVESSRDSKSLQKTRIAVFGAPRLGLSRYKQVRQLDHIYYGNDDFLAKQLGGRNKDLISNVKGETYSDYLSAKSAQEKIEDLFR